MALTILHLTDLHAGTKALEDEDQKTRIPNATRARLIDRLREYISALPRKPDYVVISGDLTIHNEKKGFVAARRILDDLMASGHLPDPEHFIVVPGNHDVQRIIGNPDGQKPERYSHFFSTFAKTFPHAHVPGDPPLPDLPPSLLQNRQRLIGGLVKRDIGGDVQITRSDPFLLDLKQGILIFAFNSTLASNISLAPDELILKRIQAIRSSSRNQRRRIEGLINNYMESLIIDGGLVGDEQLLYFRKTMASFKNALRDDFDAITKIAVLHHHVSHLWNQQLEVKKFESVMDASNLKQHLIEFGFDIVLHGHKHTNHVALDASIIPLSRGVKLNPLVVVSGGTVGGYPRLNDHQTIKVLHLFEEPGTRSVVLIQEIPLREAGDVAEAIAAESEFFVAPIGTRLPDVHSVKLLKDRLDQLVEEHLMQEQLALTENCNDSVRLQFAGLSPTHTEEQLIYQCFSIRRQNDETIFYDVVLLSDSVGFLLRSRIHALLSAVEAYGMRTGEKCRVVVSFGNLERTHFCREQEKGAISRSYKQLFTWFKSATERKLLTFRHHMISQEEINEILSDIMSERTASAAPDS